ncbi:MAG: CoA transferase [Gammaproteobacteria bacterium]|nr:CoA transferase [Gammaproteobacteria bacterium]MDH3411349.1 CoA transferase [Gammaproteobacteria bacterium]
MKNSGPLAGVRVLDLSRVLAGPMCTQLLGDLGAEVIKVERPDAGDDTRQWGPPFLEDADGNPTRESAYYLCANRNKRSLAVDISKPEGQKLIRDLASACDVLVENFKTGGLKKFGLDYDSVRQFSPGLVYCSITGFGQTGPYAARPGYDLLIQAMGGLMSITGPEGGEPCKVGVAVSDIMCGMYAAVAILAALRAKDASGRGQHIDMALLDAQVAWLANQGQRYLISGEVARRRGNAHPDVVPYQVFKAKDGHVILGVGNDQQFRRFCEFAGRPQLADDPRFASNDRRVKNRDALIPELETLFAVRPLAEWLEGLAARNVPCGPVNSIDQVFADPQVAHRQMTVSLPHPLAAGGDVTLLANPMRFSETPVSYRRAPPTVGEHTAEVLKEFLGLDEASISELEARGIVACGGSGHA